MIRLLAPCVLGGAVVALTLSTPAHASYRDGALGFFIMLYSVPVAIGAIFCTLLLWSLQAFRRGWVQILYAALFVGAALVAVGLTLPAHDPTSLLTVAVGESVFLVPVLLPAVLRPGRSSLRRMSMDRRTFISGVTLGFLTAPLAAEAQQAGKVARIGYLVTGSLEALEPTRVDALRQGLREHGYVEGQNILIEYRAADGRVERLAALAAELARLKVDVIVAVATPAGRAAQQVTTTIPIVVVAMGDPVGDGLVASLARPGGNVTGSTFLGPELVPKRLELFKEALPSISRVGVLWHPSAFSERTMGEMLKETEATSRTLGMLLQRAEVRSAGDLDRAFSAMLKGRADALFVFPSTMLFAERRRIVAFAAKHRLPAMFNAREFVELGGLMGYGANLTDLNRRAAIYVDRILKGSKPGDLPVEQPTKFELVINLKTAKALGLTIPPSLLQRADQVLE
jgi:ABC-type uncharacterized transport system substrate-binding protein